MVGTLSSELIRHRVVFMNMETIREWLNRLPFKAFPCCACRMARPMGSAIPKTWLLAKNRLAIVYPARATASVHISLVHVNSIEALQAA